LENPAWREALAEYIEIGEDDSVKLNIDSALQLAYVHSPSHQNQLETLYLSALDVTTERFRLDTQFFGGYDARYHHDGSLKNDQLSVGADPALQARRRFFVIARPYGVRQFIVLSIENSRLSPNVGAVREPPLPEPYIPEPLLIF